MQSQLTSYYSLQGWTHASNIINFPEVWPQSNFRVLALRYIFQNRDSANKTGFKCPTQDQLEKIALQFFETFTQKRDLEGASEVADILGTFSVKLQHVIMDRLRDFEDRLQAEEEHKNPSIVPHPKPVKNTVYADSQNVHNSGINQSVIKVAKRIYEMYIPKVEECWDSFSPYDCQCNKLLEIQQELLEEFPQQLDLITDFIKYISTSVAVINGISLIQFTIALWFWIKDNPKNLQALKLRLLEEMKEMHKLCTSGHLSRLVNVIQGFTDDPDLEIRISDKDQYNAVIRNYLTKSLSECKDETIIEGMTADINSESEKAYIRFIRSKIAAKLLEWCKEYVIDAESDESEKEKEKQRHQFLSTVASIVNAYCGKNIFNVKNTMK